MAANSRVALAPTDIDIDLCSMYVLVSRSPCIATRGQRREMIQDQKLCTPARAIYDGCYQSEDWVSVEFDEAERFRTVHYRQAVGAAQQARVELTGGDHHPNLFG